MQLDLVMAALNRTGGRPPALRAIQQVLIDGRDYTPNFGASCSCTHDIDSAFSSGSFEVVVPFGLPEGSHVLEWRIGWSGAALPLAFRGEIVQQTMQDWQAHDQLQAAGVLRRLSEPLDPPDPITGESTGGIAFYNSGQSDPDLAAGLQDQIPLGYVPVPIATDGDLIIHILEAYGIRPTPTGDPPIIWNHSIESSDWKPAMLSPILWDTSTPGWTIVQDVDKCRMYRTYDAINGAVYRRPALGGLPAGTRLTLTDRSLDTANVLDLSIDRAFNVFNQVRVGGAQITSLQGTIDPDSLGTQVVAVVPAIGYVPDSPYIPNPPRVRVDRFDAPYIETVQDAEVLAGIRLGMVRQPVWDTTATTFGLSDIDVSSGITIDSAVRGVTFDAFLVSHSLSGSPFRSNMRLRGSTLAETNTNQSPYAVLRVTPLFESVLIGGVLTPVVILEMDGRDSYDMDGTIASWVFTVDGNTYSGTDITQAYVSVLSTTPGSVHVSLTVTDNGGLSATDAVDVPWDATSVAVEPIAVAEAIQGEASADGDRTWNKLPAAVTAVAPIALAQDNGILAGCANGDLYHSTDFFVTATKVFTFPAKVTALWCNEQIPNRWLAGLQNGTVYLSTDGGTTWGIATSSPPWGAVPINDISESPFQANQVTVAAGHACWQTFDLVHWTALITSGSGATCLRFAAGFYDTSKVYAGFTDGTIGRWTDNHAGGVADVPITLSPAAEVRGLTLAITKEELYIFTSTTATYIWNPTDGLTTGPTTGTATNYAIRNPSGFVYTAEDGAVGKWFPHLGRWDVRLMGSSGAGTGTQALRVGYSNRGIPSVAQVVRMVVITDARKVYRFDPNATYTDGTWVDITSNLPGGNAFAEVHVSPANPNHMFVVVDAAIGFQGGTLGQPIVVNGTTSGPVWYTTNGLSATPTWTNLKLDSNFVDAPCGPGTGPTLKGAYSESGEMVLFSKMNNWVLVFCGEGVANLMWRYRLSGSSYAVDGRVRMLSMQNIGTGTFTSIYMGVMAVETASSGDVLWAGSRLAGNFPANNQITYVPSNGTDLVNGGPASYDDGSNLSNPISTWIQAATRRGGAEAVMAVSGHNQGILYSPNYRNAAFVPKISGVGLSAAMLSSGAIWVPGNGPEVRKYVNLAGTPTYTSMNVVPPAPGAIGPAYLKSDRASQQYVGGIRTGTIYFLTPKATAWSVINGPSGQTIRNLVTAFDVFGAPA